MVELNRLLPDRHDTFHLVNQPLARDERFAAAVAMRNDGWWWASPQLTHKAIKRQVLREMVRTLLGRKRKANRMQAVPSGPSEPSGAAPESATPELATSGAAHRLGPVGHRVE